MFLKPSHNESTFQNKKQKNPKPNLIALSPPFVFPDSLSLHFFTTHVPSHGLKEKDYHSRPHLRTDLLAPFCCSAHRERAESMAEDS